MPECHSCAYSCEDFGDLARHIVTNKVTHRKGYKWASSFLTKAQILNQKRDIPEGRIPLDEQEKQNKVDAQRELSGVEKVTMTICPGCNTRHPERIPVEFLTSPTAWRKDDKLLVNCLNCVNKKGMRNVY